MDADHEPAVVINERLARRDFPGQDSIGRRLRLDDSGPPLTIVGVVADLRFSRLDAVPEPELYVPYQQVDGMFGFMTLARTTGDPLALAPVMRELIARMDKTLVPAEVMTLERALAETIAPRRWNLSCSDVCSVRAGPALIGMYGLMTYWVSKRRQEIGVRMALGARRVEVVRLVIRQGMGIALVGITLGVAGALALTRVMSSLLYDVQPRDPQTFVVVTLALGTTALVACGVPAFKAARVDPAVTLRHE